MRNQRILGAAVLATSLAVSGAQAGPTPAAKCEAAKNQIAGKYAACVQNAERGLVLSGDSDKYTSALQTCESKQVAGWDKAESKAVAAGDICPSSGDATAIREFVDACSQSVATALAGGEQAPGPSTCQDLVATCEDDLAACEADTSARGETLTTGVTTCYDETGGLVACAGTGQDGETQRGVARSFEDNGDGTITDLATGLMWEKLSDDGSIHDRDTTYKWFRGEFDPPALLDASQKIDALNVASFAGHNDWRLPNHHELYTLVDLGQPAAPLIASVFHTGCAPGCTVTSCSCTGAGVGWGYWSSTTFGDDYGRDEAWALFFDVAGDYPERKQNTSLNVRAVRTGL